ncbi:hypothetical protein M422DRAFT_262564 [Sphaerobolus stellatus SS14]|uniref:Unplaced genomic scaffold SPHSTscaffold_116, whole genome shotgun sequence n=1 Tax=Sphaerobolus stellatus (strain SS14) TaxID=990650 RepID=A0A0C9TXJ2_SPHS4|nr:hypothetical protein M422DRAFT_262564 [Sphaerobolus stellatus SS14]
MPPSPGNLHMINLPNPSHNKDANNPNRGSHKHNNSGGDNDDNYQPDETQTGHENDSNIDGSAVGDKDESAEGNAQDRNAEPKSMVQSGLKEGTLEVGMEEWPHFLFEDSESTYNPNNPVAHIFKSTLLLQVYPSIYCGKKTRTTGDGAKQVQIEGYCCKSAICE